MATNLGCYRALFALAALNSQPLPIMFEDEFAVLSIIQMQMNRFGITWTKRRLLDRHIVVSEMKDARFS